MKTINSEYGVSHKETETLHIRLNRSQVCETIGSVAWLLRQMVSVDIAQKTFDDVTFRCADLYIGEESATIAIDGAHLYEEAPVFVARPGYRCVDLRFESDYQQDHVFAVPLTPAAVRIVERIAARGRDEFKRWIEEDGADEQVEILLNTQTSE